MHYAYLASRSAYTCRKLRFVFSSMSHGTSRHFHVPAYCSSTCIADSQPDSLQRRWQRTLSDYKVSALWLSAATGKACRDLPVPCDRFGVVPGYHDSYRQECQARSHMAHSWYKYLRRPRLHLSKKATTTRMAILANIFTPQVSQPLRILLVYMLACGVAVPAAALLYFIGVGISDWYSFTYRHVAEDGLDPEQARQKSSTRQAAATNNASTTSATTVPSPSRTSGDGDPALPAYAA